MRYQRRAAGGSQCGDGRAVAARHRSYRHAVHSAETLGSDSKSGSEKLKVRYISGNDEGPME